MDATVTGHLAQCLASYAPMSISKPIVGVVSDRRMIDAWAYHMVGEKYLTALAGGAKVFPVALPALGDELDVLEFFDEMDGVFLSGSISMLLPEHYDGPPSAEGTLHDPGRDQASLALIPKLLASGKPLLAVCRGFQEMNVSMGGSLHQMVHELPGYHDHRENPDETMEQMYAPAHPVTFSSSGLLAHITGMQGTEVNSLHWQGVNRLGEGLVVEARADDGLIEAFRLPETPGFNLAVQWHPEWQYAENPVSKAIFEAFGDACREWKGGK